MALRKVAIPGHDDYLTGKTLPDQLRSHFYRLMRFVN